MLIDNTKLDNAIYFGSIFNWTISSVYIALIYFDFALPPLGFDGVDIRLVIFSLSPLISLYLMKIRNEFNLFAMSEGGSNATKYLIIVLCIVWVVYFPYILFSDVYYIYFEHGE